MGKVFLRSTMLRRIDFETDEFHAALAKLHFATMEQRDDLLSIVAVVGVGAVGTSGVLDLPGARVPPRRWQTALVY